MVRIVQTFVRFTGKWLAASGKTLTTAWDFAPTELDPSDLISIANAGTNILVDATRRALLNTGYAVLPGTAQGMTTEDPSGTYPFGRDKPTTVEYVSTTAGVAGLSATQPFPPGSSAVVSLKSATPGKSFRGRQYFYPPLETDADGQGLLTGGAQTSFALVSSAVAGAIEAVGAGFTHVIVSRKLGVASSVVSYTTDTYVKSQRRRNKRG